MNHKANVQDRITRHLKGMVTLCDEARGFTQGDSALDAILRELALKSGMALLELRDKPIKA
jgi:hypothetical protein